MQQEYIDKYGYEGELWKPDYKAYNAACDGDKPIDAVISIWDKEISLGGMHLHQIWSAQCESTRDLTIEWLSHNLLCFDRIRLKMRPIGDNSPQEELFEKWLDHIGESNEKIKMVFSSHKPTIGMFRRRGIFVFDCNQGEICP